jgi:hypothetical protein
MPSCLKYYDSNSTLVEPSFHGGMFKKRFEFIVQGMQVGEWDIPEHTFTYFDVKKHAYVTLRTAPLSVSIMPNGTIVSDVVTPDVQQKNDVVVAIDSNISPINAHGPWYPISKRKGLPWWVFNIFAMIPLVYISLPYFCRRIIALGNNSRLIQKKRSFKKARALLSECVKSGDTKQLYVLFEELRQNCFYTMSDDYLRTKGFSDEDVHQWNVFCQKIAREAYAPLKTSNNQELLRMAELWIQRLEKAV